MKKYCAVKYKDTGDHEVVPSKWVKKQKKNNSFVRYPRQDIMKHIENNSNYEENWKTYYICSKLLAESSK